ncbi:MAG: hypothetical protein J1F67_07715 [Muribaculaceae bacterium]|nr:hypothetical protein [Muribaculaceae bacterium]
MKMKKLNKFLGVTAVALSALGLVSCQNEFDNYVNGGKPVNGDVSLVKAPDVVAWSGKQLLGEFGSSISTRSSNVNCNQWGADWNCIHNVDVDLTPEDINNIIKMFEIGHEVENTVVLPWENYFVQQVHKGTDQYYAYDHCEQEGCNHVVAINLQGSNQMNHLKAYNSTISNDHYEHINNFNNGDNQNTPGACSNGVIHKGTTLMQNMGTEGLTPSNQFGYDESYGSDPKFYNNYIILQYKGYWFVGFDYEMHKNDQNTHNHGEALDIERDWNFTDWIVRITPGYQSGQTVPDPEGTPIVPDPYDPNKPGGPESGDGDNEDNDNDDDDINTDIVVENRHSNEVEVNYAILDEHDKYDVADLVTKLSIHVRKATDVEIIVPIPGKYFVESDDLYIFTDHANFVYNDKAHTVNYNIGGKPVTLTVTITEENIKVYTTGIDQDVIDACWEENKDGINFEVYNYFQTAEVLWIEDVPTNIVRPIEDINREELLRLMNQATIKFTTDDPDYFINAFGANDDKTDKHDWHATVTPESDLFELRLPPTTHLNGTPYNYIWVRDGAEVDDTHKH